MDRRREVRIQIDQPAQVTVFGPPDLRLDARLVDWSGPGIRLLVDQPLTPGAALKIESGDALLLGEVCYSAASSAGFEVGVELHHSLTGLTDLARLNRQLVNGWEAPSLLVAKVGHGKDE